MQVLLVQVRHGAAAALRGVLQQQPDAAAVNAPVVAHPSGKDHAGALPRIISVILQTHLRTLCNYPDICHSHATSSVSQHSKDLCCALLDNVSLAYYPAPVSRRWRSHPHVGSRSNRGCVLQAGQFLGEMVCLNCSTSHKALWMQHAPAICNGWKIVPFVCCVCWPWTDLETSPRIRCAMVSCMHMCAQPLSCQPTDNGSFQAI